MRDFYLNNSNLKITITWMTVFQKDINTIYYIFSNMKKSSSILNHYNFFAKKMILS